MSLDDPEVVRAQYATETGSRRGARSTRTSKATMRGRSHSGRSRPSARGACSRSAGAGRAERARSWRSSAPRSSRVDVSERMVELARERGRRRSGRRRAVAPVRGRRHSTPSWPPGCCTTSPISIAGSREIARVLTPGRAARRGDELGAAPRGGARAGRRDDGRPAALQPRQRRGDPRAGTSRRSSGSTSTAGSRSPMPRRFVATSAR